MQPPFILCLPARDSLDDFEPHLLSLRWHKAFPKDGREKWDERAERERQKGEWCGGVEEGVGGREEVRCVWRDNDSMSLLSDNAVIFWPWSLVHINETLKSCATVEYTQ